MNFQVGDATGDGVPAHHHAHLLRVTISAFVLEVGVGTEVSKVHVVGVGDGAGRFHHGGVGLGRSRIFISVVYHQGSHAGSSRRVRVSDARVSGGFGPGLPLPSPKSQA